MAMRCRHIQTTDPNITKFTAIRDVAEKHSRNLHPENRMELFSNVWRLEYERIPNELLRAGRNSFPNGVKKDI